MGKKQSKKKSQAPRAKPPSTVSSKPSQTTVTTVEPSSNSEHSGIGNITTAFLIGAFFMAVLSFVLFREDPWHIFDDPSSNNHNNNKGPSSSISASPIANSSFSPTVCLNHEDCGDDRHSEDPFTQSEIRHSSDPSANSQGSPSSKKASRMATNENENNRWVLDEKQCNVDAWLNRNGSIPGYHVLCVQREPDDSQSLRIEFWKGGVADGFDIVQDPNEVGGRVTSKHGVFTSNAQDWDHFRRELQRLLKIQWTDQKLEKMEELGKRRNHFAIFSANQGLRLSWPTRNQKELDHRQRQMYASEIDKTVDFLAVKSGVLLVFEGGQFIYPPVQVGYSRSVSIRTPASLIFQHDSMDNVSNNDGNTKQVSFKLTTLSCHPVIIEVEHFIPSQVCDHVIELSERHMKQSGVSHMHNTHGDANQWRTSTQHWLHNRDDPMVDMINTMTAAILRVPRNHQEHLQVLRYYEGQQYDLHHDHFVESLYKGTKMERKIQGGRNRLATFFWYMSTVETGGRTYFPCAGGLKRPKSLKLKKVEDCDGPGLAVKSQKGNAVIFYNMHPSGKTNPLSLHGGCPVGENEVKWAANKWIWSKPLRNGFI